MSDKPEQSGHPTASDEADAFVLVSSFDTIVSLDPAGLRLVHRAPVNCTFNLVFIREGDRIGIDPRHSANVSALAAAGLVPESWYMTVDPDSGKSIVVVGGCFMGAEPGGTIALDKPHALAWEMFSRMPLRAALHNKAQIDDAQLRDLALPIFPRERKIPKIIHQTYPDDNLPSEYLLNIKKLRSMNPDFQYMFWSDRDIHDFIYTNYGYGVLEYYLRIHRYYGAARADLFRYLCIYKIGGAYLDIKSTCLKPLSCIIRDEDEYILSQWSNAATATHPGYGLYTELSHIHGGEYQQWHVIAAPGHPFLEHVIRSVFYNIQTYTPEQRGTGKIGVLRVTGPIAYTLAIHPKLDLHPHRLINTEDEGFVYIAAGEYRNSKKIHYSSVHIPLV